MNLNFILLQQQGSESTWITLLPWIAIFAVMYFFMIRPQMKKAKQAKKFREGISKGDQVVTIGGIHGKVLEVRDGDVLLDCGGAKLRVEKSALSPEMTSNEQELAKKKS